MDSYISEEGEKMQEIKLIGVCLSTVHEEDRYNFVNELNKYAVKNNYRLLIFNSCADLYEQNNAINEGTSSVFKLIPYKKLSALILFPNIMYDDKLIDEVIENCRNENIPVISIDREIEDAVTFTFANAKTFEKLCCHVIEDHGAEKIYMMAGFKNNVYSEERIDAFKRALEKNNMPFIQENVGYGCFWEIPTIEVLDRWFLEEKREVPDAIICANDFMAITVSSYLQEMGVIIPDDCIVTGFDGIKQTEFLPPKITTCQQDFDKMCCIIIDTVKRFEKGEKVKGKVVIDFNINYSQSCGCEKIDYKAVTASIRSLIDSLRFSDERQKMLCSAQISIPKISDIHHLPRVLTDKFHINTCIFALNDSIFEAPDFGEKYKNGCFSKNVDIIYQRYNKSEYDSCIIPVERLIPRYDMLKEHDEPIIICCSNFTDMIMGYCVFQPPIDVDVYKNIHNLMCVVGAALGDFHNRVQIKSMNDRLISANDELEKISRHDYLTGLFNRRGFFNNLNSLIENDKYINSTLILISIDLDGLKYINDTFGHAEGDNAIVTVGRALLSTSWQNEICARFGGDEFSVAVIIRNKKAQNYFNDFADRFQNFLDDYNFKSNKQYHVSASIGCHSEIITPEIDTEKILKIADEKMYNCKMEHKRSRELL